MFLQLSKSEHFPPTPHSQLLSENLVCLTLHFLAGDSRDITGNKSDNLLSSYTENLVLPLLHLSPGEVSFQASCGHAPSQHSLVNLPRYLLTPPLLQLTILSSVLTELSFSMPGN